MLKWLNVYYNAKQMLILLTVKGIYSTLHLAVSGRQIDTAKCLLQCGANANNYLSNDGSTPIDLARALIPDIIGEPSYMIDRSWYMIRIKYSYLNKL